MLNSLFFCSIKFFGRNNDAAESTIQSIQTWVESKDDLERLQNSSKIEKRTVISYIIYYLLFDY